MPSKRGVGLIWLCVLAGGMACIVVMGSIGLLVACMGLIYAIIYTLVA